MQKQSNLKEKIPLTHHYFSKLLSLQGQALSGFETSHIMMLYFMTHGLSHTDKITPLQKDHIREYVLSLELPSGGWAPSSYYTQYPTPNNTYDQPHIVFTYSAVNILQTVGGLDKINKEKCLASIAACQKSDGSFSSFRDSPEADLRFVYSAVTVCHSLGNLSAINTEKIVKYIEECQNFDGGYGLRPFCESHSGAIYCAIASLKMLNHTPKNPHRTLHFLMSRQTVNLSEPQIVGIQGRVGKFPDSCYSFWVGASAALLAGKNLLNPKIENFLQLCFKAQSCCFAKYPTNSTGDPIHTLHSLYGLAIINGQLNRLCLQKGVTIRQ